MRIFSARRSLSRTGFICLPIALRRSLFCACSSGDLGRRMLLLMSLRSRSKADSSDLDCSIFAAVLNRKEKAENDPIVSLYNRRCAAIRTECGRGTITKEYAEIAKRIAKERKQLALNDDKYAKTQYKKDMSREALYAEVDRNLK